MVSLCCHVPRPHFGIQRISSIARNTTTADNNLVWILLLVFGRCDIPFMLAKLSNLFCERLLDTSAIKVLAGVFVKVRCFDTIPNLMWYGLAVGVCE